MAKKRKIVMEFGDIRLKWDNLPEEKYQNYLRSNNKLFNKSTFEAASYPTIVQIEPTNTCNLACQSCPVGQNKLNRPPRHMSLGEFKKIIDDMQEHLLLIVLWDWGEPFMNPELPKMIRYATDKGIKSVTSTNAHFLKDEEYAKKILQSGLALLIIAIDSIDEKKYNSFRRKGSLNAALEGLRNTVRLKKELNSATLINLRMVITCHNEDEVKPMQKFAKESGVDVFSVKTANPGWGLGVNDEDIAPKSLKYRRFKYHKGTNKRIKADEICWRPWNITSIHSNGEVVPCCYDPTEKYKLGNVFEKSFKEIWNGPDYREFRRKMYFERDKLPNCMICPEAYKLSSKTWYRDVKYFNLNLKERIVHKARDIYAASPTLQKIRWKFKK